MAIIITIDGDDEKIQASIDSLVRKAGWTEESEKPKLEMAADLVKGFIDSMAKAYQVQIAIDAARTAAMQLADADGAQTVLTIQQT